MIVYMATNKINGKEYIGQTVGDIGQRRRSHMCSSLNKKDGAYFHNAIRKYGPENFDWEILHDGITNIDDLNKMEIYYIGYYDTFNNGYNLTVGGEGSVGHRPSKETKEKTSKTMSGENGYWYGKSFSEEHKKSLVEACKYRVYGKDAPNARSVIIENLYFGTMDEASSYVGIKRLTLSRRIKHKTKWLNYKYCPKRA